MIRTAALLPLLALAFAVAPVSAASNWHKFDLSPEAMTKLQVIGATVEAFDRSAGKPALRWTKTPGAKVSAIGFPDPPRDVSPFRRLRFRIRATKNVEAPMFVVFRAKRATLTARVAGPTTEWKRVEIMLPDMRASHLYDPEAVDRLFLGFDREDENFTIELADVDMGKGRGGWRNTTREDKKLLRAKKFVVEDFETAHSMPRTRPHKSEVDTIPTTDPKGHAVRWTLTAGKKLGCIDFFNCPVDLRPYRLLRFRARAKKGMSADLRVRFRSKGGILESRLPDFDEKWRTFEILLPDMRARGEFDIAAVKYFRFTFTKSDGSWIDFDDFVLEKAGRGWRWSAGDRLELGIDATAPVYRISNFERLNAITRIHTKNSDAEVVEEKLRRRDRNQHLRWTIEPGSKDPSVTFMQVPPDIRSYRTLRFRVKVDKNPAARLKVCLQGMSGAITKDLDLAPGTWQSVEVPLPEMTVEEGFDPKDVLICRFVYYGDLGLDLDLDDLELQKDAGGWQRSESEQVAAIFGEERTRKVKKSSTDHFLIWTDSSAVQKKFHRSLEKMHTFVCRELGIEAPAGKLSVYIFQNPDLYFDFCERKGWTRAEARLTSGHAADGYFATFYQAPGAPTVAHELTHSIVHQTLGTGGGAWFQEGIAVYLEGRWRKRSTAKEFASRIRSDEFVPVAELMRVAKLIRSEDRTGGPRQAAWLYAQAGAFFEFILRGPYSDSSPDRMRALCVLDCEGDERIREVERILGRPISDIQKEWVDWGRSPPK